MALPARALVVLGLLLAGFLTAACGNRDKPDTARFVSADLTPSAFPSLATPAAPAPSRNPVAAGTVTRTPAGTAGQATRVCDDPSAVARVRPSIVRIQAGTSVGTGIATTASLVVTAEHVVRGAQSVRLTLPNGNAATATVLVRRPDQDLALLSTAATGLTPVTWGDEQSLRPGQPLLSLGYARDIPGEPSLTGGRFSARRVDGGVTLVQTDTPLNPGNSGGPLFTQCGEVVGVVSFGLTDAQGLNFAVAATHARALASSAGTATVPPSPTVIRSTPMPSAGGRTVVVARQYGAAIRASPTSDARIVTILPCGTLLRVVSSSQGWLRVTTETPPRSEGWVGEARTADAGIAPAVDCRGAVTFQVNDQVLTRVQTGCLSLRDAPSRSAAILRCVENGTRYTILNGPVEVSGEDWFQVQSPALGTGWSLAQFLVPAR
jgi:S1-C subfamily serine protease